MWPNPQETADLLTFTGEILNGKFHFLFSVSWDLPIQFLSLDPFMHNGEKWPNIL